MRRYKVVEFVGGNWDLVATFADRVRAERYAYGVLRHKYPDRIFRVA